jgi:hypothetical protein
VNRKPIIFLGLESKSRSERTQEFIHGEETEEGKYNKICIPVSKRCAEKAYK